MKPNYARSCLGRRPPVRPALRLRARSIRHKRSPFPIVYNVGDMAMGWEIVERLAGHPDRFIPGHDPIVSEIYPRASDKVDAFALHLAPSRSFAK